MKFIYFDLVLVNGYVITKVKEYLDGPHNFEINRVRSQYGFKKQEDAEQAREDLIKQLQSDEKANSK